MVVFKPQQVEVFFIFIIISAQAAEKSANAVRDAFAAEVDDIEPVPKKCLTVARNGCPDTQ